MPYVPKTEDEFYLQQDPFFHPTLQIENDERKAKVFNLVGGFLLPKHHVDRLVGQFGDVIDKSLNGGHVQPDGFPMFNTFVTKFPNNQQAGDFLGLDIGGTNLRIASVHLEPGQPINDKLINLESFAVPVEVRQGESGKFFDHLAQSIGSFLEKHFPQRTETISLGFTFSFGYEQLSINHGRCVQFGIQTNLPDALGKCPRQLLQNSIDSAGLPVKVVVLANDSTTTLIYGRFLDEKTRASLILGSGSNVAYIEKVQRDKRIKDAVKVFGADNATEFIINSECVMYGDHNEMDFAKTHYDIELDSKSLLPNSYTYEKMLGGAFLGELFRLALLDLIRNDLLLGGKMSTMLEQPNSISTSFLSCIDFESVCSQYHSFEQIDSMLIHQFDYQPEDIEMDDRKIIAYVSALITARCALLCAIELAPFINRMDNEHEAVHVSCDGSLFSKHPKMDRLINGFLGQLCPAKQTKVFSTQNGGVIGSAMLAACYNNDNQ